MTLDAIVVSDEDALAPELGAWTALAEAARAPFCLPGWMLAWWRHTASPGTALRIVLVRDGVTLVGVAPYFAHLGPRGRSDHRLLTAGLCHRIGPLAAPGREAEVARAVAAALAMSRPRPTLVSFEGVDGASPWPDLMRDAWPGIVPPGRYRGPELASPVLPLDASDFATWFAGRSRNFRSQLGRWGRRLEGAGGEVLLARTPDEVEEACAAFPALHEGRWEGRGGSSLHGMSLDAVLRDAARGLAVPEQLRLWCVRLDGRLVSVQVFVAAGGEVGYWSGGWDDETAELKPPMVTILAAIEDAYARGDTRIDFGGGAQDYKLRFAKEEGAASLRWTGMFPLGARYPVTRAEMLPHQASNAARRLLARLPEQHRQRLRRVLGGRAD